jgi:glycosyltransferase involved in cell wall biosynthesis
MVGDQGGAFSDGVHAVVRRLGLDERTLRVPITPDIDDWYRAADAFVLASDIESLPRSMLEAMAFGLPVVASGVFGVPEVIDDGRNGFLFDASSVSGVSDVLVRVLGLPRAELERVGISGRRTIEASRSSEHYAAAYRSLLDHLIAERNGLAGTPSA